ncbi:MAG: hypothetical protein JW764_07045, partial [Chlorobiaceae bacterium]|nr:hypothetical protein [Chlorobiaceae bacterium]
MKEHTLIFLLSKLGEMSSDEIISFDGVLLRASNSLIAKIDEFKGELKHNNWSTSSVGNIFSNIFKNDDSVMMEDLVGIPHVKTNDILYISDKDI